MEINKKCECCGKPFVTTHAGNKYCGDVCRSKVKRKQNIECSKRMYKAPTEKKKTKKSEKMTIEQINAEAIKAGMSYGKYVALKGL